MQRDLTWQENGSQVTKLWVSESDFSPPKKILFADDSLKAVEFYQQASEGAAYIYTGDFQNAKQLLQAVQRRIDKTSEKKKTRSLQANTSIAKSDEFHKHRQAQAHKARLLSRILIVVNDDLTISLRRAPQIRQAIIEAIGETSQSFVISLRELLGYIGAHEWRKKGITIAALGDAKIHPYYGIFSPVRGEYLDLVAQAPLPPLKNAFDIGTGTGVLAAILARRGVQKIIATDLDPRAIACATENISRLGLADQVQILKVDMFPDGIADLIVCNPPWVPARATSSIERAIYDENSDMLKKFLAGLNDHLSEQGEAWLIMSDLAEHLGLRSADAILEMIKKNGLKVVATLTAKPRHLKAKDLDDPLYEARSREVTSLWRLKKN